MSMGCVFDVGRGGRNRCSISLFALVRVVLRLAKTLACGCVSHLSRAMLFLHMCVSGGVGGGFGRIP